MAFLDLFVKSDEEGKDALDSQDPIVIPTSPSNGVIPTPTHVPINGTETQEYVSKFREALRSTNTIGMKFVEILYKLSPDPKPEDYAKAVSLLQIMDTSASTETISASLHGAKDMILKSKNDYIQQGNQKLESLRSNCDGEKKTLEREITDTQAKITSLEGQLNQCKSILSNKQAELTKIDGKYQPTLDQTTSTIAAVTSAADETIASLEQMMQGLKH
jgi:predicted RNase H-like nuclease (RuvC/YqgF family)